MNKIKIGVCVILVVTIFSCNARTKWPKEMPEKTKINYSQNGGMRDYSKKIEVINDSLFFSETINRQITNYWSTKIEISEKQKLYQAFVENKFDKIKNQENKQITYDAGSETISIGLFDSVSYDVSYGKNYPLSKTSFNRYTAVADAIAHLVAKYEKMQKNNNIYSIIPYDSATHWWIFKEEKATNLSASEIAEINTIVEKAVQEGNAKRSHYSVMELTKYNFQYIPVITKSGEKQVWVNAFCNSNGVDWSKDIVAVEDGGNCYWNMTVNLTKKTYYNFSVNGSG